jgi:hypothetical protein
MAKISLGRWVISQPLSSRRDKGVFQQNRPKAVVEARAITLTGIEEQSQIRLL